ncbi:MAG TPA: hypothetical protein VNO43_13090 [Candidatus Eisenbacteria bacterium]|nr:hypothetical protein [Candidatus Eisenbacteria bacterium]
MARKAAASIILAMGIGLVILHFGCGFGSYCNVAAGAVMGLSDEIQPPDDAPAANLLRPPSLPIDCAETNLIKSQRPSKSPFDIYKFRHAFLI